MSLNAPEFIEGKSIPSANILTQALLISDNVKFATLQIMAINDTTSGDATVRIAISDATNASNVARTDYIETGDKIKPHGKLTEFGVLVKGNQRVYVQSSNGNVIFRVTGLAHLN